MLKEISPKEFQDSGMVWYINQQLHLFGLALAVKINDDGTQQLIPCKCRFRGFDTASNDEGYQKVTKYIEQNISRLKEDI